MRKMSATGFAEPSLVTMQVSKGARNYANGTILRYMAQGAVEYAKELGCANPQIVLHLDHGDSFELCKINIDSDSPLAMTAAIRKYFDEHPEHFDPRQHLKPARENMQKMYEHKIVDVLGSNNKL